MPKVTTDDAREFPNNNPRCDQADQVVGPKEKFPHILFHTFFLFRYSIHTHMGDRASTPTYFSGGCEEVLAEVNNLFGFI